MKRARNGPEPEVLNDPVATGRDFLVRSINLSVIDDTRKAYDRKIDEMKAFLLLQKLPSMTKEAFFAFLRHRCPRSRDQGIADGYKSAVRFEWLRNPNWLGDSEWLYDEDVKQGLKGISYQGRAKAVPAGNIEPEMFEEMTSGRSFLELSSSIQNAFQVIWRIALRQSEFFELQVGDLDNDHLLIRTNKIQKAGAVTENQPTYLKRVVDPQAYYYYRMAEAGKKKGDKLFPVREASARKIDSLIKSFAEEYKWPVELRWSIHCLRHGGTTSIIKLCKDVPSLIPSATCMSEKTRARYSRSNVERLRRLREYSEVDDLFGDPADSEDF